METLRAIWALLRACRGLSVAQIALLRDIAILYTSPLYAAATCAVIEAARVPPQRHHHHWQEIRRVAKAWDWSAALHRRLEANERTARVVEAPARQRELAVEVAYHAWRATHPAYRAGARASWEAPASFSGTGLSASVHSGVQ